MSKSESHRPLFFPVVPARAGSSWKDKNLAPHPVSGEPLLVHTIRLLRAVFAEREDIPPPTVLTDSAAYADRARAAGALVPFLCAETPDAEDVTVKLRRWVSAVGIDGWLLVVCCTAPFLRAETLRRFVNVFAVDETPPPPSEQWISVVPERAKFTGLFAPTENGTVLVPAVAEHADIPFTRARQLLPEMLRFTGAVWLLHSSALANPAVESAASGARLHPIRHFAGIAESLDLDSPEQISREPKTISTGRWQDVKVPAWSELTPEIRARLKSAIITKGNFSK